MRCIGNFKLVCAYSTSKHYKCRGIKSSRELHFNQRKASSLNNKVLNFGLKNSDFGHIRIPLDDTIVRIPFKPRLHGRFLQRIYTRFLLLSDEKE